MYFSSTACWLHRWAKGCIQYLSTDFSWNYHQHWTNNPHAVWTLLMMLNTFRQKSRSLVGVRKQQYPNLLFWCLFPLWNKRGSSSMVTAVTVSLRQHRNCRIIHTGAQRLKWAEDQITHSEKTGKALRHGELTTSATPTWLWRAFAIQLLTLGQTMAHRPRWGGLPPHFLTTMYLNLAHKKTILLPQKIKTHFEEDRKVQNR